jgi:hypothetical protein
VFDQPDAWDFVKEVAWQARLSIWTRGKKAYLRYLPKIPESVFTLDPSNVLQDSIQLGYTKDENLVTKLDVDWRPNYFVEDQKIIYRQNISRYALVEESKDIFIYNIRELVVKSASYWLMRFSHVWREVTLSAGLDAMHIDKQDAVTIDIPGLPETLGIVQDVTYDPQNFKLDFKIWLPLREVDTDPWVFAFPYDVPQEYVPDFSEFGNPVFPDIPSDRNDLPDISFKPQDYPSPKLNDIADDLPEAPTVYFGPGEENLPEDGVSVGQNPATQIEESQTWRFASRANAERRRKPMLLGSGWIQENDPEKDYEPKEFEVLMSDGRQTTVIVDQVRENEKLPFNHPVQVIWDGKKRTVHVPTWVEDDVPPLEKEEED